MLARLALRLYSITGNLRVGEPSVKLNNESVYVKPREVLGDLQVSPAMEQIRDAQRFWSTLNLLIRFTIHRHTIYLQLKVDLTASFLRMYSLWTAEAM